MQHTLLDRKLYILYYSTETMFETKLTTGQVKDFSSAYHQLSSLVFKVRANSQMAKDYDGFHSSAAYYVDSVMLQISSSPNIFGEGNCFDRKEGHIDITIYSSRKEDLDNILKRFATEAPAFKERV